MPDRGNVCPNRDTGTGRIYRSRESVLTISGNMTVDDMPMVEMFDDDTKIESERWTVKTEIL